jgi:hypothetical protein
MRECMAQLRQEMTNKVVKSDFSPTRRKKMLPFGARDLFAL